MTDNDLKNIQKIVKDEASSTEQKLSKMMDEKLAATQKGIFADIGNFISDNLIPVIAEKADKSDIDRLERKIDTLTAKPWIMMPG